MCSIMNRHEKLDKIKYRAQSAPFLEVALINGTNTMQPCKELS